ncbi:DHA2 family efflux MFS transporter permease subunit [Caldovatus aquaticus]|uniref:DHA2 family efflux MFS transporter permease subunit n=1 Tax=Caldovatus aquaticus TaxID=2865671 RepID=A0ABS7F0M1_9PROT|nr:DHA2 family efflux MFS transporter permease subunit [Caldovatus aquaticus]MBW8269175.1 DHA2 family efflux MFS transporter permease subunit [Caldovatus aquaticus]
MRGSEAPEAGGGRSVEALFARYGPAYRWLVAGTALMGTLATVLSSTIANVALPEVMGAFGIGQDQAQLISAGFLAATTGTMLLNAWLVESFGFRAVFVVVIGLFALSSVTAGLAPNAGTLIASRILQGACAGVLQPMAMQIIFAVFPPDRRGAAMGLYAMGVVLAPAFGPSIGGLLVDDWGWRFVFLLGVPFTLAGLGLGMMFMPGRQEEAPMRRFDWLGFGLLALALGTLLGALSSGQREGWGSDFVVTALCVAGAAWAVFFAWEAKAPAPLLNPRVFAERGFGASAVTSLIYGAGMFGSTYLIPLFVQLVQGYTATRAGLLLMPAGLVAGVVFPVAGRLSDKVPGWKLIVFGLVVFAVSCWLMAGGDTDTPFWTFALWTMIGRAGMGFAMPSINAGALRALPPRLLAQGAGAISFTRMLGGALGVTLLSVLLEQRTQFHAEALAATQHPGNPATMEALRLIEGLLAQDGLPETLRRAGAEDYLGRVVAAQAGMLGFRDAFLALALAFAAALAPGLMTRRRPPLPAAAPPRG